uniref:DUF1062 domain-containing protein n=1 Tax=Clostridium sp. NkU-1 TaxID=1095009 RepID=UPI0006D1BDE7
MNRNLRKQWTITPNQLPAIIRRCPKCGKKTEFRNSGKFRVNANGRLIDVWLIYRCGQCETSWNMTIWERTEAGRLEKEEYEGFLQNDPELAEKYGNDRDLFARNKVEAAASKAEYHVTTMDTAFPCGEDHAMEMEIRIPAGFDLRADIFLMQQLSVSRSRIKKWCEAADSKRWTVFASKRKNQRRNAFAGKAGSFQPQARSLPECQGGQS